MWALNISSRAAAKDVAQGPTVTPEHVKAAAELGFVPHLEKGKIWFTASDIYAELVASGKLTPGTSIQ